MTVFDIEKARRETRAAEKMIHFNNAGSSLMPIPVADALHAYLKMSMISTWTDFLRGTGICSVLQLLD